MFLIFIHFFSNSYISRFILCVIASLITIYYLYLTHLIRGGEYTKEFLHEYINEATSPHRASLPSQLRGHFALFHPSTNLCDEFLETKEH